MRRCHSLILSWHAAWCVKTGMPTDWNQIRAWHLCWVVYRRFLMSHFTIPGTVTIVYAVLERYWVNKATSLAFLWVQDMIILALQDSRVCWASRNIIPW